MRKDIIDKWCDNLESGEFEQAQYTLCRSIEGTGRVGYCCLGLLAETLKRDFPDVVTDYDIRIGADEYGSTRMLIGRKDSDSFMTNEMSRVYATDSLPDAVFCIVVGDELRQEHLVRKNDNDGCSFKDIAEYIRLKTHTTKHEVDPAPDTDVPADFSGGDSGTTD
jgi:hypothetical protein